MNHATEFDKSFVTSVKQIAAQDGTPFYIYDEATLRKNIEKIRQAFSWQNGFLNYFPVRENPNPALLRILWEEGIGLIACGPAELSLCASLGFRGHRLMYLPVTDNPEGQDTARELDVSWLIVSPAMIPKFPCSSVCFRYCPDTADPRVSGSRFKTGFTKEALMLALSLMKARCVPEIGLEVRLRTFDHSENALLRKVELLKSLLGEIESTDTVSISCCNLGDASGSLSQAEIDCIRKLWETIPAERRPVLHAGFSRPVSESAGYLVSKVLEIREKHQNFLVMDASVSQFVRSSLFGTEKNVSMIPTKRTPLVPKIYHLVGPLPDEFDRLSRSKVLLAAAPGDLCLFHDVGCGAGSMPLLYNFQPICKEYLIDLNRKIRLIRTGRSAGDVMKFLIEHP